MFRGQIRNDKLDGLVQKTMVYLELRVRKKKSFDWWAFVSSQMRLRPARRFLIYRDISSRLGVLAFFLREFTCTFLHFFGKFIFFIFPLISRGIWVDRSTSFKANSVIISPKRSRERKGDFIIEMKNSPTCIIGDYKTSLFYRLLK